MLKSITTLFVLGFAAAANAGIVTGDFSGSGNIAVLVSDDWRKASPDDKVGCLNSHGKMIKDDGHEACGVFTKLDDYPYTLSTKEGNCTFEDKSQERNTDSAYGQNSFAFNCNSTYVADVYDSLYTIVSHLAIFQNFKLTPPERLPLHIPVLGRHRLLLRCQKGPRRQRNALTLAVHLGLSANGNHARPCSDAAAVGKDWQAEEQEQGHERDGDVEGSTYGGYADFVARQEVNLMYGVTDSFVMNLMGFFYIS